MRTAEISGGNDAVVRRYKVEMEESKMTERQQLIVKNVDAYKQLVADAERWLWAHPQTGFTEWEAHGYMAEKFQEMGY